LSEEPAVPSGRPVTRRVLLIGGSVAVAGGVAAYLSYGGKQPDASKSTAAPLTAPVRRQDLADERTFRGTLDYGPTTPVADVLPGVLTGMASVGTKVDRGQALFRVNDKPVVLLFGTLPMWRDLSAGCIGNDVSQLTRNLIALRLLSGAPTRKFSDAVETAVKTWQHHLGLPRTGKVLRGQFMVSNNAVRVDRQRAIIGAAAPGPVLDVTGIARAADIQLTAVDANLAVAGTAVTVVLPTGDTVPGTISQVISGTSATGEDVYNLAVGIPDQAKIRTLPESSVSVQFTLSVRKDVLTVPVLALLALADGGYGVEVLSGGQRHTVPVVVGLTAGATVEVSATGLSEGMQVVIPQ